MAEGRGSASSKLSLARVSAAGRRGMTVRTVVHEQPQPRSGARGEVVTSGRFLPPASTITVASRKSGFRSGQSRVRSESRHGLVLSEEPDEHRHRPSVISALQEAGSLSRTTTGLSFERSGDAACASGPSAARSLDDVDICMGLGGLVLVGEEDDILVKEGIQPYTNVRVAIDDLLTSPWHKYYQRPPLNTPGLLAIGDRQRRWCRPVDAPTCAGQSWPQRLSNCCCCCCARRCCNDDDDDDDATTVAAVATVTAERRRQRDMETLLVFHSDDIAVALNCCMRPADRGDASSSLHVFIDELKREGSIEERLFVRWVGFDGTFPGVEKVQETTPIHAQVARRLGYWPRYNFYDHCLDIMKNIYGGETYDPSAEYGMGCWRMCSVFSFHWRGGVPKGEGWNQRDEHYYHA